MKRGRERKITFSCQSKSCNVVEEMAFVLWSRAWRISSCLALSTLSTTSVWLLPTPDSPVCTCTKKRCLQFGPKSRNLLCLFNSSAVVYCLVTKKNSIAGHDTERSDKTKITCARIVASVINFRICWINIESEKNVYYTAMHWWINSLSCSSVLSHLFITAVVPHGQAEEGCQGILQLQPFLWSPGGAIIAPAGRLAPAQSIYHPVAQLHTRPRLENLVFLLLKLAFHFHNCQQK